MYPSRGDGRPHDADDTITLCEQDAPCFCAFWAAQGGLLGRSLPSSLPGTPRQSSHRPSKLRRPHQKRSATCSLVAYASRRALTRPRLSTRCCPRGANTRGPSRSTPPGPTHGTASRPSTSGRARTCPRSIVRGVCSGGLWNALATTRGWRNESRMHGNTSATGTRHLARFARWLLSQGLPSTSRVQNHPQLNSRCSPPRRNLRGIRHSPLAHGNSLRRGTVAQCLSPTAFELRSWRAIGGVVCTAVGARSASTTSRRRAGTPSVPPATPPRPTTRRTSSRPAPSATARSGTWTSRCSRSTSPGGTERTCPRWSRVSSAPGAPPSRSGDRQPPPAWDMLRSCGARTPSSPRSPVRSVSFCARLGFARASSSSARTARNSPAKTAKRSATRWTPPKSATTRPSVSTPSASFVFLRGMRRGDEFDARAEATPKAAAG